MERAEQMAADIALTMNGGEWKDGKWYSKGHREAWIKAVKPYADEIERLREALNLIRVAIQNYGNGGKSEGFALGYVDEVARAALKGDER